MGAETKIEWCDHTFNPWRGCSKVHTGCTNCYAEKNAKRNPRIFGEWGDNGTRVVASEAMWREPLKWDRDAAAAGERRRVFCASLADVFEDRPELESPRWRLFRLIQATPHLDWLLLTKRPAFAAKWLSEFWAKGGMEPIEPLPNVWIGASVSDQKTADEMIPALLRVPAAVRFLSVEPLVGPVDLDLAMGSDHSCRQCGFEPLEGAEGYKDIHGDRAECVVCKMPFPMPRINWVICGGESGPKARPCDVAWIRAIVQQCAAASVPCFVKQLGANVISRNDAGWSGDEPHEWPDGVEYDENIHGYRDSDFQGSDVRVRLSAKGGDMNEWPEDLRVREFPAVRA